MPDYWNQLISSSYLLGVESASSDLVMTSSRVDTDTDASSSSRKKKKHKNKDKASITEL